MFSGILLERKWGLGRRTPKAIRSQMESAAHPHADARTSFPSALGKCTQNRVPPS